MIIMVNLLRKIFIKDYQDVNNSKVRNAHGTLASIVGIVSNFALFLLKLIIGLIAKSVSIIGDSFNNLADMASSSINLLGFKIANKPADKEHPYGHARFEYIAGLIISVIIIVFGIQVLTDSIDAIINNTKTEIDVITLIILAIAIIVKLWQGYFYRKIGKTINSVSLIASSQDSINDVLSTSAIFVGSLVIYFVPDMPFSLDGVLGIIIALLVLFSGIKMVKETADPLIGINPDHEYVKQIINDILAYKGVLGVHDIRCHMYGPTKSFMTVHVEVSANENILEAHDEIDNIEREISEKYNIELTIHMDPIETDNEYVNSLKEEVGKVILPLGLSFHDFRVVEGHTHTNVLFDVVIPRENKITDKEVLALLKQTFKDRNLYFVVHFDGDYFD